MITTNEMQVISGNLFDAFLDEDVIIVHGCNAQGVMGSGVARFVRDNFPKAYYDYVRVFEEQQGLSLGQVIMSEVLPRRIIANAITQRYYGGDGKRYVDYDAVRESFRKVYTFAKDNNYGNVAFPKIGAGLGGGDWGVIEKIIKEELKELNYVLYVV